jgi:hypothetical protein
VLASFTVGAGILLERPEYSAYHEIALWLVIVGIAIEACCTIFLFVFDEGISSAQQSKIVDLESKLEVATMRATSRRLITGSAEQRELTRVMSKFAGIPVEMMAYKDDHEDRTFAIELMRALQRAGLNTPPKFERVDAEQIGFSDTGIMLASGSDERSKEALAALTVELNNKLLFCVGFPAPQVPDDIRHPADGSILVFVGYKGSQSKCK